MRVVKVHLNSHAVEMKEMKRLVKEGMESLCESVGIKAFSEIQNVYNLVNASETEMELMKLRITNMSIGVESSDDRLSAITNEMVSMREEMFDLKQSVNGAVVDSRSAVKDISILRDNIRLITEKVTALEKLNGKITDMNTSVRNSDDRLADVTNEMVLVRKELTALKQSLNVAMVDSKSTIRDTSNLQDNIRLITEKVKALEQLIGILTNMSTRVQYSEDRLEAFSNEMVLVRKELAGLKQSANEASVHSRSTVGNTSNLVSNCSNLRRPLNGALACITLPGQRICQLQCNGDYDVPSSASLHTTIMRCRRGRWTSTVVPDCKLRDFGEIFQFSHHTYYMDECPDARQEITENFIDEISRIGVYNVSEYEASRIDVFCGVTYDEFIEYF